MLVTQLTVVNACLASMGEEPINSLAEENAFVNSAKFALENANINEQSAGWWYNKERLRIIPDVNGSYVVPSDVIDLVVSLVEHTGGVHPPFEILAAVEARCADVLPNRERDHAPGALKFMCDLRAARRGSDDKDTAVSNLGGIAI